MKSKNQTHTQQQSQKESVRSYNIELAFKSQLFP